LHAQAEKEDLTHGHIGVLAQKRPLTAIEHGIKIGHTTPIDPQSLNAFVDVLHQKRTANALARRLSSKTSVISVPPDLSSQLIRALAERPKNYAVFTRMASLLTPTRSRPAIRQLQADAIKSALEIFALPGDAQATKLELSEAKDTELSRYWLQEDSVIERDARQVPGLVLTNVHVTGRAEFRRGDEIGTCQWA
jgi:hypothetical protein